MHINIGQRWANVSTLDSSLVSFFVFSIHHHSGFQVLSYQPEDIGVFYMPLQKFYHPFVVYMVEESFDVCVNNEIYFPM